MIANVLLGQVSIGWNVEKNVATVRSVLEQASPSDLVVLPEGMISGYDDELSGLASLDPRVVSDAADTIADLVRERGVHLFCGTLHGGDGAWSNVVLYFSPEGERQIYCKVNLATHERPSLVAGAELSLFALKMADQTLTVSPQLCRELRFPDQWHVPARRGAQVFVYLTNAVGSHQSPVVWKSHLISRAAETQRFVLAVNVAHRDQLCPTMIVAPSGDVIVEAPDPEPVIVRASIDVAAVSDWYLDQQRSDVVRITYPA